jgi:hypothetical protein
MITKEHSIRIMKLLRIKKYFSVVLHLVTDLEHFPTSKLLHEIAERCLKELEECNLD